MHKRAIAMVAAGGTAVALLGAAVVPANAAPKDGAKKPYVVIMGEMPALGYEGGVKGIPATKPAQGKKINPKANNVKKYVKHLKEEQTDVLADAGIKAKPVNQLTYAANGFAVQITDAEAAKLRQAKGVMLVMEDVLKQKQTDVSPQFLGLTAGGAAWMKGYTGKGVVVGVIDTGIWPEHASFADNGLPTPSGYNTDVPCEFGGTGGTLPDADFMCQDKLLGARDMRTVYNALVGPEEYNSARDSDGHGTHTAGTAAGNKDVKASIFGIDRGTVSGIAPDASIIAYKGLGNLGGYSSDLAGAIDQAVADGVDVINYSIGSASSAIGPDDIAFLFAADAGVHVATSAGNSGPGAGTIGSPAAVPWLTTVGASTHNRTFEATATLGNGATYTGASVTEGVGTSPLVDSAAHGNPLCLADWTFTPSIEGKIVLCARGTNARVDKSMAVADQGGVGMILYNQTDAQALVTDNHWIPSVHITYSEGMEIKDYIASGGDAATASITEGKKTAAQANVMADFSSRGPVPAPASPDIIRPDVTAPGVNILAGNTPTPNSGRPGQLFQSISGTSMSSPQVAGLFALLKQAHPTWTPAIAKSAIMTTARQDVVKEDGKTKADPFDFGAGHVNPGRPQQKNSMFDPGVAYDADLFDYAAFVCGAFPGVLTGATCDGLDGAGYSFEASQLNVPSIGVSRVAGSYIVERTLTNVSKGTIKLTPKVENPAGYTMTVSPARIEIPQGQSRTFTVTIKNNSGAIGEWKFGSLTWTGQGYNARIPVAVAGADFRAPLRVSGTGASGTGSLQVGFGYTGAYSASSFGLAPEVLTEGTVGQDPDQTFSPGDAGNGATRTDIDLTGVKYWRLSVGQDDVTGPGAENVDLDLYVFSLTTGRQVTASGSEGTNEVVELRNPSGEYAVFVHGWFTGGRQVGYTTHSWTVGPPENGGTLKITSAPASAVDGATGTIEYSWSGVASGTTGLGVITHNNAAGEMGQTLVTIKN